MEEASKEENYSGFKHEQRWEASRLLCEVKDERLCISIQCNWIMKAYFMCFLPI